jgi:hypothetical protein
MILFEDIRSWWRRTKKIRAEEALLSHLPRAEIDASKLGKIDKGEIDRILTEPKLHEEWLVLAKEIDQLILIEDLKTGGVNPRDRRALYYLVRALGLKRVLEIGTNVGASTIHLAAAMKANLLAGEKPNEHSLRRYCRREPCSGCVLETWRSYALTSRHYRGHGHDRACDIRNE